MKIMRPRPAGKNLVQVADEKQVISLQWPFFFPGLDGLPLPPPPALDGGGAVYSYVLSTA